MKRMEVKVRGSRSLSGIIGRVLNRSEVLRLFVIRNNDHSAWMLTCCSFYSHAALNQPILFSTLNSHTLFFQPFFNKSIGRFVCKSAYRTRFEHILLTKQFLRVFMCLGLKISGKVEIYIRLLISVKPKKCLKRNIVSFSDKRLSAYLAVFRRQIES